MLVGLLAGCRTELLSGLSQRQANEAIALLQRNDIASQKKDIGKGRFKIEVDRSDFPDAVGLLHRHQLPTKDDLSIADLFPTDSLVNSPAAERARLISGLEQRLEQTIRAIEQVLSARVHISYPLSERNDVDRTVHASIMVNYDGPLNDALLIQRLKQLVKNSFDALSYDNISVVVFHSMSTAPKTHVVPPNEHRSELTRWIPVVAVPSVLALLTGAFVWRRRKLLFAERTRDVVD